MTLHEQLAEITEKLVRIQENQIADREYRELGHRVVWNAAGDCNVPGMHRLTGDDLKAQLERQRKYY